MIKAVIIDDERNSRETLEWLLESYCPDVSLAGSAKTVQGAIELIKNTKPELVFLDIELSSGTGFDVLDGIAEKDFEIIFVTAFDQYAIKAFEFSAVSYLLKPVNINKLKEAVARVTKSFNGDINKKKLSALLENMATRDERIKKLMVPTQAGLELINIDDIIRCKGEGSYACFFLTSNKKVMVSKPLKGFESALEGHHFFRIHQTHLVNLKYVEKYIKGRGGALIMKDGSELDVSRHRKDELLKKLSEICY